MAGGHWRTFRAGNSALRSGLTAHCASALSSARAPARLHIKLLYTLPVL